MLRAVIRRSAARRAQPALAGSSAQPIEVRSWLEPAWFCLDPGRDRDCLNQPEFHRVGEHSPQKSGEPDVAGKGSGRARTGSLGQEPCNDGTLKLFSATRSLIVFACIRIRMPDQPEKRGDRVRCCRRNQNKISRTKKRAAEVNTMVAAEDMSR